MHNVQESAARDLGEAKGAWEARGQRQRAELREVESRLERQEKVHGQATTSLQRDITSLQQRLSDSQVGL